MRHISTLFLKLSLLCLAFIILAISFISLPKIASDFSLTAPELAFLHYPLLFGIWATLIPFNIAIYKAFMFLHYATQTSFDVNRLKQQLSSISSCAVSIIVLYSCGMLLLIATNASHPGIMLFGFAVVAICFIIIACTQFMKQYMFKPYQVT